jgi:hypothetical protein|tara:strand:- start:16013 stop:16363 length:351 start_codon:yes stop_codon:yes gene_type:complete
MKVKVQYTVDFDDIPNEVSELAGQTKIWLFDATDELVKLDVSLCDEDMFRAATDAIVNIENIRAVLARADLRLQDCDDLLRGFLNLLRQQEEDDELVINDKITTPDAAIVEDAGVE